MNPSVSRVPRNQFGEAKQKKKAPVTSPFRKPLLCVGTQRFPLPRITVKTLAPFQRADFFCLNEAKGHANTTNDALWAAIAVARHGGEPGERERFRGKTGQF